MPVSIREIHTDSEDYQKALRLREDVLRKPLGRHLTPDDTKDDPLRLHFGLFSEEELIACVQFHYLKPHTVQLKQMAVAQDWQKKGIGQKLLHQTEQILRDKGVQEIHMHARINAQPFYEKLGYTVLSEAFMEVGIPHIEMFKRL